MTVSILIGDVRDRLREMPADSVDCVVTSPPYWGLRDYGVAGQIGLEPTLGEHLSVMVDVFEEVRRVLKPTGTCWINYGDCYATSPNGRSAADTKAAGTDDRTFRDKPFSTIGGVLKPKDLAMVPNRLAIELQKPRYMGRIKEISDRVWLACLIDGEGSIFGSTQPVGYPTGRDRKYVRTQAHFDTGVTISNTCRALLERCVEITGYGKVNEAKRGPTNRRTAYVWRIQGGKAREVLAEVYPHLVAKQHEARLAIGSPPSGDVAQKCHDGLKSLHQGVEPGFDLAAPAPLFQPGWWVRSEIIWAKPNPMPESINDRPATSHEKIFLLSKAPRYHYDADAVRQGLAEASVARLAQDVEAQEGSHRANGGTKTNGTMKAVGGRRLKQAETAESAARAGGSSGRRMAGFNERWDAKEKAQRDSFKRTSKDTAGDHGQKPQSRPDRDDIAYPRGEGRNLRNYEPAPVQVWPIATRPFSEAHFATFPPELAERCLLAGCPKGGTVLDPFGGAGTTALVADRMGLDCTIIELNPEYAEIARKRIASEQGMFANVSVAA